MSTNRNSKTSNSDAFEEFNKMLEESARKGQQLTNAGRELTETGQFIVDLSHSTQNALRFYKPKDHIEELISNWETLNRQMGSAIDSINDVVKPVLNTSSGSATVTITEAFNYGNIQANVPNNDFSNAEKSIDEINQVTQRIADKNGVILLMKLFKLDIAVQGQKSPLELFVIAHDAFGTPVSNNNPVVTSLIPIRESINLIIDKLLKERPIQEPASNERTKIISIGNQLRKDFLEEDIISSWADQWHSMNKEELSSSKDKDISRKEWQYRLNKATIFIKNILEGLDVYKLKSNQKS